MAERELELTYVVTIRSYGHPAKQRRQCGKILARLCGLNFQHAEVRIGSKKGNRIVWSTLDHDLGMGPENSD